MTIRLVLLFLSTLCITFDITGQDEGLTFTSVADTDPIIIDQGLNGELIVESDEIILKRCQMEAIPTIVLNYDKIQEITPSQGFATSHSNAQAISFQLISDYVWEDKTNRVLEPCPSCSRPRRGLTRLFGGYSYANNGDPICITRASGYKDLDDTGVVR